MYVRPRADQNKHDAGLVRHVKVKPIGKGSFGEVWLIQQQVTGQLLVQKDVKLRGLPLRERRESEQEVTVLRSFL